MKRSRLPVAVIGLVLAFAAVGAEQALTKTNPSTWRQEGWLGFRFGMGPGDVYAVLRDPDSEMQTRTKWLGGIVPPGMSHEFIALETTYILLGVPLTASFKFAEGRLVSVSVMEDVTRRRNPSPEKYVAEGKAWGERLHEMIVREVGRDGEESDCCWEWMQRGTRVRVMKLGALSFSDAEAFDAAEAKGVAAVRKAREDTDAGVLPKTNPATWKAVGWGKLRWGMGPGDVAQRIAPVRLRFPEYPPLDRDELSLEADLNDVLYGRYLHADFKFRRGRLTSVYLSGLHAESSSFEALHQWYGEIKKGLLKKYGHGLCEGSFCRWRAKGGMDITLIGDALSGTYNVFLFYAQTSNTPDKRSAEPEAEKL